MDLIPVCHAQATVTALTLKRNILRNTQQITSTHTRAVCASTTDLAPNIQNATYAHNLQRACYCRSMEARLQSLEGHLETMMTKVTRVCCVESISAPAQSANTICIIITSLIYCAFVRVLLAFSQNIKTVCQQTQTKRPNHVSACSWKRRPRGASRWTRI